MKIRGVHFIVFALFIQFTFVNAQTGSVKQASVKTNPTNNAVWKFDDVVLVLIDYQPQMFQGVNSQTPAQLIELNVRFLIRSAKAFGIPVILSSVSVNSGINGPTVAPIADELPGVNVIDRQTMNAWEDANFRAAVKATGKKRIVFAALWTEICLVYPVISSIKDGFEAMFVADAVGGRTDIAQDTGFSRMIQAGAVPNTTRATIDEWFRSWDSPQAKPYHTVSAWYKGELKKLYPDLKNLPQE